MQLSIEKKDFTIGKKAARELGHSSKFSQTQAVTTLLQHSTDAKKFGKKKSEMLTSWSHFM